MQFLDKQILYSGFGYSTDCVDYGRYIVGEITLYQWFQYTTCNYQAVYQWWRVCCSFPKAVNGCTALTLGGRHTFRGPGASAVRKGTQVFVPNFSVMFNARQRSWRRLRRWWNTWRMLMSLVSDDVDSCLVKMADAEVVVTCQGVEGLLHPIFDR